MTRRSTHKLVKPSVRFEYGVLSPDTAAKRLKFLPKIDEKAHFELKGQFLKELHDNTFSGADNEDVNEHIEKVLEIVDLFHIPEHDKTLSQAWECFKELLLRCPQHYLTNMQEVILFYKGLDVPTRQILDFKGAIPSMNATNAKKAIQDMVDYYQKWHNGTSTRARSTNTSDGLAAIQAQLNNLGREIKKVNELVYVALVGCESCNGPHYTKDCPLKEDGKTIKEAYYTQFRVPFLQGGRYRAAALGFYQRDNANPLYLERRQIVEESLSKFMAESAKRHAKNSNLIKEIRVLTDDYQEMDLLDSATYIKSFLREKPRMGYQMEALTYMNDSGILEETLHPKEKYPGSFTLYCYINDICFEKALAKLGASVSLMPYSTFTNLGLDELAPTKLIVKLADITIKCPKGVVEDVLVGIDKFVFLMDFVVLDMPEDIKVPLILERPFLSTAHAKIDVFKRKIALKIGNDKIISLDHVYGDYIELNDLNEPLELWRNQVEDLGPTIEDGEVIDKPIIKEIETWNDDEEANGINEYPSFYDNDRKIHIDCAYNLQFSCMIGFKRVNANFFPILSINIMSKKFFNYILKDKMIFKGKNVIGAFINVPTFVGNFSIITDFAVFENIDAYRDEGMSDIIVGKPFRREICIKAMRFDGMITIYNGNNSVSEQNKLNGMSHPYQKLKSFYKEVLNLGPEYIRDAKIEETLKCGHVSIHEME
ncbi:putative reverse transcriptase domain-containing protein [Tanacetum coccineum]|uniref:Reverse transcriptase domain-containing protein n=1 Tax=Tanacetum coccineum TaxID=301880 RepID=A0ABQ5FER2_9ASTR